MSDVSYAGVTQAAVPAGARLAFAWTDPVTPDEIRACDHPESLEMLIHHPAADVRIALAENPHAPVLLLRWLRRDRDARVRAAVAAHPHTGSAMLWQLAADADCTVRLAVAQNPETPPSALVILADDAVRDVILAVIRHPSLPLDVLARLVRHDDPIIRASVARHPMTTETMLLALAVDASSSVVMAVCLRQWLPERVRALLIETNSGGLDDMIHAVLFGEAHAVAEVA
jgi:hypothetical protein